MDSSFELLPENIAEENLFWAGLTNFVKDLHRFINLIPSDSPILLNGDWGSGKTSAISALATRLGEYTPKREVIIFEAWRYEQESSLLNCLIRDVWEKGHMAKNWKKRKRNLLGTAVKATAAITVRSIPAVLQLFPGGEIIKEVVKGLSTDKLKKEFDAIDFQEDPEVNYTDQLHKSFKDIVNNNYKSFDELVIIIDDLDRCSPESAIHLLESMRILINNSQQGIKGKRDDNKDVKIRFVVAMDKITLSEAVENKFSELSSYDANRYLEKLFPYMFNLPKIAIDEVEEFILRLITSGDSPLFRINCAQGAESHFDNHCINLLTNSLNFDEFQNPRLIKRCINKFALCMQASKNRTDAGNTSTINRALVTWIAATEKWPLLKRLILVKPLLFWESLKTAIQKNSTVDDLEGQTFLRQSGFKEFYKAHFINDVTQSVSEFRKCETVLNLYGL